MQHGDEQQVDEIRVCRSSHGLKEMQVRKREGVQDGSGDIDVQGNHPPEARHPRNALLFGEREAALAGPVERHSERGLAHLRKQPLQGSSLRPEASQDRLRADQVSGRQRPVQVLPPEASPDLLGGPGRAQDGGLRAQLASLVGLPQEVRQVHDQEQLPQPEEGRLARAQPELPPDERPQPAQAHQGVGRRAGHLRQQAVPLSGRNRRRPGRLHSQSPGNRTHSRRVVPLRKNARVSRPAQGFRHPGVKVRRKNQSRENQVQPKTLARL